MDPATSGTIVAKLGETGGAIGLICGVLLLAVLFFLRYMMQNQQRRDIEFFRLNKELQEALVNNTSAMITLAQILQHRRCLADDIQVREQINKATHSKHCDGK